MRPSARFVKPSVKPSILLHTLRYAETVLWSPVLRIEDSFTIAPEQGKAMSLLRRLV